MEKGTGGQTKAETKIRDESPQQQISEIKRTAVVCNLSCIYLNR